MIVTGLGQQPVDDPVLHVRGQQAYLTKLVQWLRACAGPIRDKAR
jgi:hypothetical protein